MDGFLCLDFSFLRFRKFRVLLSAFWIAGLLFGSLLALAQGTEQELAFFSVSLRERTLHCVLFLMILPLFGTFAAVCSSRKWFLFILVFLKAFSFSYIWVFILSMFDSSNWLIRSLLMFVDSLALPVYWWVWLRIDSANRHAGFLSCFYGAALIILICCVDYAVVAPFWTRLIDL